MLMRSDPFREFDRLTDQLWGNARLPVMPMDAYKQGDEFLVHFDLPGVESSSIDLTVEKNVLTVKAERSCDRRRTPAGQVQPPAVPRRRPRRRPRRGRL